MFLEKWTKCPIKFDGCKDLVEPEISFKPQIENFNQTLLRGL